MKSILFICITNFIITMTSYGQQLKDTVADIDGNVYHTVKIGTQTWIVENLKVTHYRNGDLIDNIKDSTEWFNRTTGAYMNYQNDTINVRTYGRLYNWYAVNDKRGLAPTGWHIPSEKEWLKLIKYLDGEDIAGKKMKSTNTWNYDGNGTNESGFSGLPCGTYDLPWGFQDLGTHAYWWSSTGLGVVDIDGECASIFTLSYSSNKIEQLRFNVSAVLSIRCVKD